MIDTITTPKCHLAYEIGFLGPSWHSCDAPLLWCPVDTDGIVIYKVPFGDKTLIRRERLVLAAKKSKCGKYFTVEVEDFDMVLSESTLAELKDVVDSVLRILWRRYVMGDPERMTLGAVELTNRLKATYRLA